MTDEPRTTSSDGGSRGADTRGPGPRADSDSAGRDAEELAHDLTEGLGTIALFAGSLEHHLGAEADADVARDLAGIRAGIERLDALIAEALGPDHGGDGHRPLDANDVVRNARASLEARVAESGARIVSEPLPWVLGNRAALTRVFQNLLANSIEHRDPQSAPRIRIGARREGERWLFEVEDNGRGIEPERAERASAAPDEAAGRGLGLGICARIVAAHGGRIRVAPRTEGGTLVSFDLPRARRVGPREATATRPSEP